MASRTLALDVAVSKELLSLLVVELLRSLLNELTVVIELLEKVRRKLMVNVRSCAAVNVERNTEVLERLLDDVMITVNNVLHRASFLLGADSYRHSVFVRTSHEEYVSALQAEIAYIDVTGNVGTGQVADVYRTVGVWKCRRNGCSLKILLFHPCILVFIFCCKGNKILCVEQSYIVLIVTLFTLRAQKRCHYAKMFTFVALK